MLRWGFLLLGVVVVGLGLLLLAAQAVLDQTVLYAEYGGTVIQSQNALILSNPNIQKAGSTIPANGTDPRSPVTLATTNPLASQNIAQKNYFYRITVGANSSTPADTTFKVTLYRWNPSTLDYAPVGTPLYVRSDATPTTGETARLYFDLGTTPPAPTETFMITVE